MLPIQTYQFYGNNPSPLIRLHLILENQVEYLRLYIIVTGYKAELRIRAKIFSDPDPIFQKTGPDLSLFKTDPDTTLYN